MSNIHYVSTDVLSLEEVQEIIYQHKTLELSEEARVNIQKCRDYLDAKVVIIEEAQFYPDLVEFVLEAVEVYEKHIIVAGLDGDASRKPFGKLLDLIPYADSIVKLKALCKICNDGTEALFTSKKIHDNATVDIGGSDKYEALCRRHFIAYN